MRYLIISFAVVLACASLMASGCAYYDRPSATGYDSYNGRWAGDGSYGRARTGHPPGDGFVGDGSYYPPPPGGGTPGRYIGDGSYRH